MHDVVIMLMLLPATLVARLFLKKERFNRNTRKTYQTRSSHFSPTLEILTSIYIYKANKLRNRDISVHYKSTRLSNAQP